MKVVMEVMSRCDGGGGSGETGKGCCWAWK